MRRTVVTLAVMLLAVAVHYLTAWLNLGVK